MNLLLDALDCLRLISFARRQNARRAKRPSRGFKNTA